MIPAIAWLYWTNEPVWGTVLLVLAIPIGMLDNVLRPILIRRGVQLPMLLIIAGVIGGLIGFGVLGLFVGPVILAATYTLAKSWVADGPQPADANPGATMKPSINWLLVFIPITLVLEHAGGVSRAGDLLQRGAGHHPHRRAHRARDRTARHLHG